MPWNNSGMASGAASGAAAGTAVLPGWGTAIGAVVGGVAGGMNGAQDSAAAPQLPATRYPGAVSSPYGSMMYDPVTGGTRYVQNQSQGAYNPSSYQDASLYDALMGGNSASSGLTQQMQQQQLMLDQLKAKGGGKMPTLADFNLRAGADGKPLLASDYINKGGVDWQGNSRGENPFWEDFMRQTGGQFGGTSGDIAFAKWAREVDKNAAPQLQSYQNALKTYESNTGAANDAIQQQELQLAQLKAMAGDPGSASVSTSQNPLLLALQQQEAEANSPYYLKSMNAQTQGTYDNQLQAQEQALAARGLGSSGLGEMTRARMGLQLGNQFNQNALAAGQQATDKRQMALNNRMNMLNFLSGRKDAAFSQGMQKEGLGMQQVNMGMGYGMQNINNATQRDVAQTSLDSQYNLANMNNRAAQSMADQKNWASALGGIGTAMSGMGGGGNSSTAWSGMSGDVGMTDNGGWAAALGTGEAGTDGWGY